MITRKTILCLAFILVLSLLVACNSSPNQAPATSSAPLSTQTRIAFDWNYKIYTMNNDGTGLTKLSPGEPGTGPLEAFPIWSPDGSKIVLISKDQISQTENDIYVMNRDGSNRVKLPFQKYFGNVSPPLWSPNSDKLVYFQMEGDNAADAYIINADGTNLINITNNKKIGSQSILWSPDGSRLSYVTRDGQIFVINSDGSNNIQITQDIGGNLSPRWSPDGTKIAYIYAGPGTNSTGNYLNCQICVIKIENKNKVNITNNNAVNYSPIWSPDSSNIAFWSLSENKSNLYVVGSDGNNIRKITDFTSDIWKLAGGISQSQDRSFLQWTPDSSRVVFSSPPSSEKGKTDIYIASIDRSKPIKLTNDGASLAPILTADGSKIIFTNYNEQLSVNLFSMDIDGNNRLNLTQNMEHPEKDSFGFLIGSIGIRDYSLFPFGTMKLNPWILSH
jgi:Tol biopolymer transport system component